MIRFLWALCLSTALLLSACATGSSHSSVFGNSECAAAYEYHFLNRAAQAGDLIGVELLLRKGADPNGHANDSYTECVAGIDLGSPLLVAISQRHYEVIELLLKSGADPHLSEGDGTTPYVDAQNSKDPRLLELIAKYSGK